jgi:8-oxo-dGTP pyrophosphatase MutT (NUDIX family)
MLSFVSAKEPLRQPVPRAEKTSKRIRGRLVGASLLCFAVDPTFRCTYFLLGKERHNYRWPAGSSKWSDFGGSVSGDGDSAESTAAREFMEETLAVVRYFPDDVLPRTSWHDIAADLTNGNYTIKITQGDKHRKFVMFVKQIPWDPDATYRFSRYRAALTCPRDMCTLDVDAHPAVTEFGSVRKEFIEKKILSLWSVPQLRRAVNNNGVMVHRGGRVEHCRETFLQGLDIILNELEFVGPGVMDEH